MLLLVLTHNKHIRNKKKDRERERERESGGFYLSLLTLLARAKYDKRNQVWGGEAFHNNQTSVNDFDEL